jgi:hypothetical protein
MTTTKGPAKAKTDAGNGSYGICRVIDASRSPSPDPTHCAKMSSRVPICDPSALEEMHTGSLLSRLKLLQKCEESPEYSDRIDMEEAPDPAQIGFIEFKNTSAWAKAYGDLKMILATREHLPTSTEREARRKDRRR